jgi:hypothetical protein
MRRAPGAALAAQGRMASVFKQTWTTRDVPLGSPRLPAFLEELDR